MTTAATFALAHQRLLIAGRRLTRVEWMRWTPRQRSIAVMWASSVILNPLSEALLACIPDFVKKLESSRVEEEAKCQS
jgi:hypothetical protein